MPIANNEDDDANPFLGAIVKARAWLLARILAAEEQYRHACNHASLARPGELVESIFGRSTEFAKPENIIVFSSGVLAGFALARGFGRRLVIDSVAVRKQMILRGRAVHVSDGDTFKMMPRSRFGAPMLTDPIVVRVAGIDAPETAKFGNPGQPKSEEAKQFVMDRLLDKPVKIQLLSCDQYRRYVCQVWYSSWIPFWWVQLNIQLVSNGLASVYEQSGAEYGVKGEKEHLLKIQDKARSLRRGIWDTNFVETPNKFKERLRRESKSS